MTREKNKEAQKVVAREKVVQKKTTVAREK